MILDEIAAFLYEHETITGKEFVEIYERISGRKVDSSKRLLSDSLLKSDKEEEKKKQKAKEKEREKEEKRKEGHYGVFRSPYAPDPTQGSPVAGPEDEAGSKPEAEATSGDETEREEMTGPMPWETYAKENGSAEAGPDPKEETEAGGAEVEAVEEESREYEETEKIEETEEKDPEE